MLHIKKITFNGFKNKDLKKTISFSDSDISIIYGDNGAGKTTFLKLIHAVLNRDSKVLLENNVSSVEISFVKDNSSKENKVKVNKISRKKELEILNTYLGEDKIRGFIRDNDLIKLKSELYINNDEYDWSEFEKSLLQDAKSLTLGIERGMKVNDIKAYLSSDIIKTFIIRHREFRSAFNNIDINEFSELFYDYVRVVTKNRNRLSRKVIDIDSSHVYLPNIELNQIEEILVDKYRQTRNETTKRIQNALFVTLSNIIDNKFENNIEIPCDFEGLVKTHKKRIINALYETYENNPLKQKLISFLQYFESYERENDNNKIMYLLLLNMIRELEKEQQSLSSIYSLVKGFNSHLSNGKKLEINADEVYVSINNEKLSLSELSSGEKHIFTFLSLVNIIGNSRDFLIIDEPEISLNVNWQRELLSLLKEIAPKTQIIVASHSPLIAKDYISSLVKLESN